MDATNLAELYSLAPLDWAPIQARLEAGIGQAPGAGGPNRHTCWLTTINPDGSPHVTGIGALWADGAFWFETGERTRKAANLVRDPRCALSVATADLDQSGSTNPAGHSPPSSAHRRPVRHPGSSTGCSCGPPPGSRRRNRAAPLAGGSETRVGG
jgi:hypothetical protein